MAHRLLALGRPHEIADTNLGDEINCTADAEWTLSGHGGLLKIVDGLVTTLGGILTSILGDDLTATATCGDESADHVFRITLL